ncbi:uncharacterized protein IUM83_05293 [Phytophthora cinnamomi]|uniref:uncharacterized protein n=1 Tax=Phytophthora cinnamomi TaxID=4785 RepID=UPI00355A39F2|nr:hypothetical protein IUM83_05293 [Phytophthora cinnamomi]
MGRGCTMEEWSHFQKLPEEGRVPNSSYWYVLCRHCVAGFEQKQLFNAPAKLTGRRSAMRAHLKVCPMYGTQYQMEQSALQEAAAAAKAETEAEGGAAGPAQASATTGERRKRRADGESSGPRGGRGKHCMMEEWEHFTRLQDEGYIGKSNFFYAVCKHCQRAHDEAGEDQKPLLVPEKLVGRREKMRKHLSLCPHFKGDLPPMERRLLPRGYGLPPSVVFSALAAGTTGLAVAPAAAGATDLSSEGAAAAATAVASAVVATTNNGSSRLALDEWHFFTRLERKKDSAYYYARCNFCQQAYENAPESMKAGMEPAVVMGRKSNMQTHLAKCLYLPKDPATLAKVCGAGLSSNIVVDEWKEVLESKLHVRGVDFSLLEDKFDGMDEPDIGVVTTEQGGNSDAEQTIAREQKLPSMVHDDELTFPSIPLCAEFSTKVPLKDLLKTAEATI